MVWVRLVFWRMINICSLITHNSTSKSTHRLGVGGQLFVERQERPHHQTTAVPSVAVSRATIVHGGPPANLDRRLGDGAQILAGHPPDHGSIVPAEGGEVAQVLGALLAVVSALTATAQSQPPVSRRNEGGRRHPGREPLLPGQP